MPDKKMWETCLHYFEETLPPQQFNSWIKPLICEFKDNCITLTAPNTFILKVIQDRFLPEITRIAKDITKHSPQIDLKIGKKIALSIPQQLNLAKSAEPQVKQNNLSHSSINHSKLNGSLAFENFVTGKANQLAHAAAMQVANFPGTIYNPLFIYGGVGLGKTHLIQSIDNLVKKDNPQAKICYVHATNYISDVVRAFQTKKFDEFKQFYNSLDLLLIDDIQFIADKPGTQQVF